jgi:hypothetical protein
MRCITAVTAMEKVVVVLAVFLATLVMNVRQNDETN